MVIAKTITGVMGYILSLPLDLLLILGHFLAHIPIEKVRSPLQKLIVSFKGFIGPFYWLIANPLVSAPFYTLQIAGMGIFGYSSAWLGMMMLLSYYADHAWMIILWALLGLMIGLFAV